MVTSFMGLWHIYAPLAHLSSYGGCLNLEYLILSMESDLLNVKL